MNLLFVCNHRGGANSIIPILILALKNKYICNVVTTELNKKFFQKYKLNLFIQNTKVTKETISKIITKTNTTFLITGTSEISEKLVGNLEVLFTKFCLEKKIFTLSVLDFWTRYRERYSSSKINLLDGVPDHICVINQKIKKEMINQGFDKQSIIVTGNPHLEFLKKNVKLNKSKLKFIKLKYNLFKYDKIYTYISQPLSERKAYTNYTHIEYNEKSALNSILNNINDLIKLKDYKKILFFIKIHPSENKNKYAKYSKKFRKIKFIILDNNENFYDICKNSNIVIGLFSMSLIELSHINCNVISYQPTSKDKIIDLLGIKIINDKTKLLDNLLNVPKSKLKINKMQKPTKKIFSIIKRYA